MILYNIIMYCRDCVFGCTEQGCDLGEAPSKREEKKRRNKMEETKKKKKKK